MTMVGLRGVEVEEARAALPAAVRRETEARAARDRVVGNQIMRRS